VLTLDHLPDSMLDDLNASERPPSGSIRENELELIRQSLDSHQGNVSAAADAWASAAPPCTASSNSCARDAALIVRLIDSQNPKLCNQRCAGSTVSCAPSAGDRRAARLVGLCFGIGAGATVADQAVDRRRVARAISRCWC
jgi:hypothetical protein